jgi:hypothetical protein
VNMGLSVHRIHGQHISFRCGNNREVPQSVVVIPHMARDVATAIQSTLCFNPYGNLALQIGGVSDETVKYGYAFCATRSFV